VIVRLLRLHERDQLQVRTVLKRDERVVGPVWMLATLKNLKTEVPIGTHGPVEITNENDQVVDTDEHWDSSRRLLDTAVIPGNGARPLA
jgi:hypothetical protein